MSISEENIKAISKYLSIDPDERTRLMLLKDLANQNIKDFQIFNPKHRLEFGTAGLRGILSYGYTEMNYVTIMQTVQGVAAYLKSQYQNQNVAVVVGYDGRHYSKDFSEISTGILAANQIKVYITSECCPTPTVAYLTKYYKDAVLGIMITASHNPTIYNGFKVYGSDGIQIIEPTNQYIQDKILENLEIKPESYNFKQYLHNEYCHYVADEQLKPYFDECQQLCYNKQNNQKLNVHVQYSAMYGVGYKNFRKMAFNIFNFGKEYVHFFEDSIKIDANFGGLPAPNPELNENMQRLADISLPETQVIVAADPDSDRLAVSEKQKDGKWYHFNGCEIGLILTQHQINHTNGDDRIIVSTTVSTHLYKNMAKQNNIDYRTTLTGFKWIARAGRDSGKKCIIGWEEAIGYTMSHDGNLIVLDKDGVSSACVMIECANECYGRGKTLYEMLHEIYDKYGYYSYYQKSIYFDENDDSEIHRLFLSLIGDYNNRKYRKYFGANNEYEVVRVRDLKYPGYDSKYEKPLLPIGNAEMVTMFIKSPYCKGEYDIIFTRRMSGTERKAKEYIEAISSISYDDAEKMRHTFMQIAQDTDKQVKL